MSLGQNMQRETHSHVFSWLVLLQVEATKSEHFMVLSRLSSQILPPCQPTKTGQGRHNTEVQSLDSNDVVDIDTMWFRPFPAIFFGLSLLAATVVANEPPKVAVAFVDVKFDDKAAIWSLLLDNRYSKVIAITTGMEGHGRAAYELKGFLDRQNQMPNQNLHVDSSKLHLFQGGNPLGKEASHENWWYNNPSYEIASLTQETLHEELEGERVRIFQIAPTAPQDVVTVLSSADRGSIESYMLLHGYNSRQGSMADQTEFLRSLRTWLQHYSPEAEVYFTTSAQSYPEKNGGKQPINAIREMFHPQDLDQAIQDGFWSRQLRAAMPYVSEETKQLLPLNDVQALDNYIYHARMRPEQYEWIRQALVHYVREALANPNLEPNSAVRFRLQHTLLPEFSGRSTVELADAAHIAAFHQYMDSTQEVPSHVRASPAHYPIGPHDEGKSVGFERARGNDDVHGMLITRADRDTDLLYIKRLAGLIH